MESTTDMVKYIEGVGHGRCLGISPTRREDVAGKLNALEKNMLTYVDAVECAKEKISVVEDRTNKYCERLKMVDGEIRKGEKLQRYIPMKHFSESEVVDISEHLIGLGVGLEYSIFDEGEIRLKKDNIYLISDKEREGQRKNIQLNGIIWGAMMGFANAPFLMPNVFDYCAIQETIGSAMGSICGLSCLGGFIGNKISKKLSSKICRIYNYSKDPFNTLAKDMNKKTNSLR